MAIVTADMSMSLDGFIAGPKDDGNPGRELEALERLHAWMFPPIGDFEQIERERFGNVGAVVMGRRMFDLGEPFWGDEPSFHAPVFVLTHRARDPLERQGGTTYLFVTTGLDAALARAKKAAADRDVMVMGGANALQQFLKAGLLGEMLLHVVPVVLGEGIRLFDVPGMTPIEMETAGVMQSGGVAHVRLRVRRA